METVSRSFLFFRTHLILLLFKNQYWILNNDKMKAMLVTEWRTDSKKRHKTSQNQLIIYLLMFVLLSSLQNDVTSCWVMSSGTWILLKWLYIYIYIYNRMESDIEETGKPINWLLIKTILLWISVLIRKKMKKQLEYFFVFYCLGFLKNHPVFKARCCDQWKLLIRFAFFNFD